ncbi:MAG: triple tyrosine motif-containing protein [Saprospiraceae bacterium]
MTFKNIFLFLVNYTFWVTTLMSQIPKTADLTIYNHISNQIDRSTSGIYQDHFGFMWITGSENIYRFDGVNFQSIFDLKDKNFVFPQIQPGRNDILQDNKDRYWFLTPESLVRWDPKQPSAKAWTKYGPNPSDSIPFPSHKMHRIVIDSKGYIWIVFDGHDLYKIDPDSGKAIQRIDFRIKESGYRRSEIDAMEYNMADNRIYFGADYIRMIAVNPDNGKIEHPHLPLRSILKKNGLFEELENESITDFIKDKTDWWLSLTNNIILRYSFLTGTYKIFKTTAKHDKMLVSRIKKGPNGMIWYSNVHHGLQMIDSRTDKISSIYDVPEQISALGNIIDIYFDKKNVMWLATSKFLAKYDENEHFFKEYQPYQEKQNITPNVFFQDKMKNEFIGTNDGLMYKLKGDNFFSNNVIKVQKYEVLNIINICFWYKDHYLLGTTNGMYIFQLTTKKIKKLEVKGDHYSLSQYYENPANSIVLDTIDNTPVIWLGSKLRYLYKYTPSTKNMKVILPDEKKPEVYHHQVIHNIVRTQNGEIWLSTSGGGISKMVDKRQIKFNSLQHSEKDKNSIQNNNVTDFVVTNNGHFWLSTYTGIDIYNHKIFNHIKGFSNISRNSSALVKGRNSDIWSVSGNELIKWSDDGRLLKIYPKGKYDFNSMFFKQNGQIILWENKSDQFTDFSSNNMYVFDSEKIIDEKDLPRTMLTYLEVGNDDSTHLLFRPHYRLNYNQNNISFSFAFLSFRNGQSNQFTWKLDGLDVRWNKLTSQNYVSYSALKPGDYVFRVKSRNAEGIWDEEGDSFAFTILAPFYQTWWFMLLSVISIISIFWYLLQQRTQRLLAVQRAEIQKSMAVETERKRIARDMHDDLGSGLSAIHLYSEYLKNTFSENNPVLSEELELIVKSSADLNQKVREIIWSNETSESNTSTLISFIKIYVQELNRINFINIVIDDNSLTECIELSHKQRKDIYLCVKEALNNVIKYANATEVVVKIWGSSNNLLHVSIEDDGQGFNIETALLKGGHGLKNIVSRVSELNGKVSFISAETGTKIHMTIESFTY